MSRFKTAINCFPTIQVETDRSILRGEADGRGGGYGLGGCRLCAAAGLRHSRGPLASGPSVFHMFCVGGGKELRGHRSATVSTNERFAEVQMQCQRQWAETQTRPWLWCIQPERTQTAPGCGRAAQWPPYQTQWPRHSQQPGAQNHTSNGPGAMVTTSTCGVGGSPGSATTTSPGATATGRSR